MLHEVHDGASGTYSIGLEQLHSIVGFVGHQSINPRPKLWVLLPPADGLAGKSAGLRRLGDV